MTLSQESYMQLAALRDELLANPIDHPDLSPEDRELIQDYERATIRYSWRQLTGEDLGLADTLCVQLRGGAGEIDSYTSGSIQKAIHQAAASIAKWQRKPSRPLTRVTPEDRAMAPLPQPQVTGNMIIFRVPSVPSVLPGYQITTAAAPALRELVATLPSDDTDAESLQGIYGAHPLMRQAVQAVSKAAMHVPDGVDLDLFVPGESDSRHSVLTQPTAQSIDKFLSTKEAKSRPMSIPGYLDGFRTTRRVFYLILNRGKPSEREIAGAVSGNLIDRVRELTGQDVIANVIATEWVKRNESRTPATYELESVNPAPQSQDSML